MLVLRYLGAAFIFVCLWTFAVAVSGMLNLDPWDLIAGITLFMFLAHSIGQDMEAHERTRKEE